MLSRTVIKSNCSCSHAFKKPIRSQNTQSFCLKKNLNKKIQLKTHRSDQTRSSIGTLVIRYNSYNCHPLTISSAVLFVCVTCGVWNAQIPIDRRQYDMISLYCIWTYLAQWILKLTAHLQALYLGLWGLK